MFVAAFAGSLLASRAPLALLAGVFGSVALLIALKMLLPLDHCAPANTCHAAPAARRWPR